MAMDNGNRICYVDPNDVRDNIDGIPLTPDYTDFNVSCYLYVETISRSNNQANGTSSNNENIGVGYQLTGNGEYVSVMRGKDYDRHNFLTTDYVNIDYSEVRDRNIIEGLQIESIDIGFTNYQTPQITIKFVDIRGGGFFGREEATHNEYGQLVNLSTDEDNKLVDNFFACFVTFPYPKFRLQVKGFYGKPVTYQLTCTSFNGNFNCTTGNFEITVQFIGYEYGLLGDIPFNLLVYAPETGFGSDYWARHVNSVEWQLDREGKEHPQKLKWFFNKIKSEMSGSGSSGDSADDININNIMLGIEQQLSQINAIKNEMSDFKALVRQWNGNSYTFDCATDNENVMVLLSNTQTKTLTKEICDKRNSLKKMIIDYNSSYSGETGGAIPETIVPNYVTGDTDWTEGDVTFGRVFDEQGFVLQGSLDSDELSDTPSSGGMTATDFVGVEMNKIQSQDKYTVTEGVSERLYTLLYPTNIERNDFAYCAVIDFGAGESAINSKIQVLNNTSNNYLYNFETVNSTTIYNMLNMSPYIGRYYKMVMCHLETFVALFNNYVNAIYQQIENGNRKPEVLGIRDLNIETDAPKSTFSDGVPPFPAVYKKYTTTQEADYDLNSKDIRKNVWVGDFSGNWLEKTMVDELYNAAQQTDYGGSIVTGSFNNRGIGYSNMDFDPFTFIYGVPRYVYNTPESALMYIGLQAQVALNLVHRGVISANDAKTLGEYNAYIFAKNEPTKNGVVRQFANETTNLGEFFYNALVYGEEFQNYNNGHYEYEFVPDKHRTRNPMFVPNGSNTEYKYITSATGSRRLEFVPIDGGTVQEVQAGYEIDNTTKNTAPKDNKNGNFVVNGSDINYISNCEGNRQFAIVGDSVTVQEFQAKYKEFSENNIQIGNKRSKDFTGILKDNVLVDSSRIENFNIYNKSNFMKFVDYNNEEYSLDYTKINELNFKNTSNGRQIDEIIKHLI